MSRTLVIEKVGPAVSVQDLGRPGGLGLGLSRGGAADKNAFIDGALLLDQSTQYAALEMAGFGGTFRFTAATRFALSGAAMRAMLDGTPIEWNAAHHARAGETLEIGAATSGVYGYLHVGGGIDAPIELGGRGFHRIAGLGAACQSGDQLPLGDDSNAEHPPMRLAANQVANDPIRVMNGPQTELFAPETRAKFESMHFTRSARANRQGVGLEFDETPFSTGGQLTLVSDFISEGDIQMTGDGTPYVLLADCQTMGGYPRIGTVLPCDVPRIAQAMHGDTLQFRFVSLTEAESAWQSDGSYCEKRKADLTPRVRDPREIADLLSYELVDRPDPEVAS